MLVIDNNKEIIKLFYIRYLVLFQKNQKQIKILLNSGSKVNIISFNYIKKLGFKIWKINIKTQKIDSSILKIFKKLIINF